MSTIIPDTTEKILPVVPIRDGVVFPSTEVVLTFGRPKSLAAIESAFAGDKMVAIVMQKNPSVNDPEPGELHTVGTLAKIDRMLRSDGEINALVRGITRINVASYETTDPFFSAKILELPDEVAITDEITALANHLTGELRRAVNLGKTIDFLAFMNIMSGIAPGELANQAASVLDIKAKEKQELLEQKNVKIRLEKVIEYLAHELKVLEIERKIANKTQERFNKSVRDTVLRERLKTIEKELGQDTENKDIKLLEKKIKKVKMPPEVEEKAMKELKRLAQMSGFNPEASYLRTYLDWLVDLPWDVESASDVDMKKAEEVLNQDHYALKKMKERIVEYLAVLKLKSQKEKAEAKLSGADDTSHTESEENEESGDDTTRTSKVEDQVATRKKGHSPTILCFVGPPGVGKTSIGRSIAKALGRKFVKMSLGGVRDEAEIRGHRRTYVGSLPGRIIQGIKTAGTKNPVFMLDEIDKVGNDFRGDPSSALLEALDPEQNFAFSDHYLEVPFDLSDVFFITTCNVLDTIPPALRDRLEIIHFAGYTTDEKFHIAKNFLFHKQLEAHGVDEGRVLLSDEAYKVIIQRYTREAGVRSLERQFAQIFRKVARKIAEGETGKITIEADDVTKYLGPFKFSESLAEKKDEAGMSTGLAWTEAGGDILSIEVATMPGKGALILTGQLGDVMKESGQAALSYVRSRWKVLGLPEKFYQKIDIHIHVPEGAVPKDGPSAGLAITTALVSALTKVPVRKEVAMTGEVTLRGRALEIGGVKEKVIAAHRSKIKTIIMPKANKKDLEDIPQYVLDDLKFYFVEHVDEVLKVALTHPLKGIKKSEELVRPVRASLPS